MNRSEIHVYRDGRVRLSGAAYRRMRHRLAKLADYKCEICGAYCSATGEVDHIQVRGMGGARRDDRIMVNGVRQLRWVCRPCHSGRHVPGKVVPAKPKGQSYSDSEFDQLLGVQ